MESVSVSAQRELPADSALEGLAAFFYIFDVMLERINRELINAREDLRRELQLASRIQRSLMPERMPPGANTRTGKPSP